MNSREPGQIATPERPRHAPPALEDASTWPTDLRPCLGAYFQQRLAAFQDGFRHNLALLGPVGSGKTTLLQRQLEAAEGRFIKIYCLLQRDSAREFLRRFSAAVLRGALEVRPDASLETMLRQAESVAPKTVLAIRQLERRGGGSGHSDTLAGALDLVALVHHELGRPCVLVLDEFLHLEELGGEAVFHELGKRVMTWPFSLFVLSSSCSFRARKILRERLHLLFGQFELMASGPVELPAATAWMEQELITTHPKTALGSGFGVEGSGLSVEGAPNPEPPTHSRGGFGTGSNARLANGARFLLHWAGASPWYLSLLLKRMKELGRLERELGPADPAGPSSERLPEPSAESLVFRAAWDVLGHPDGSLYQRCAARVEQLVRERYGPIAREALLAIANGARITQAIARQCGTRRSLSEALQTLLEHDLIERNGDCWVIPDSLLACWLAGVLAPQQQTGADGPELRRHFDVALHQRWSHWVELTAQPLEDRIRRLFSQFRNETVALDHKTGRLPSFHATALHRPPERDEVYLVADGGQRRWCCVVAQQKLEEAAIAAFEQFCRRQNPRPSRKIVALGGGLDLNAKLLAKQLGMWVWEPEDVDLLLRLYGHSIR
ncbi:MAG: hypothetical protein HYZ92_02450 [Candidatus Omnitrophica bacterium]|nr:hypothetical protein [Candidatus Omnitrophota bacterium]